ncbi:MAG: T9SS type A sorting domain-containing protein [Rhodothermales bacterium]
MTKITRHKLFFLLLSLLVFGQGSSFAQESRVLATVCTQDLDGNAPLQGTTIVAQVADRQPVAGTTAADGCVSIDITPATSTGTEDDNYLSRGFQVAAPYPNPVRNEVDIPFSSDLSQQIELSLFDITGREVLPVYATQVTAGLHRFNLDMGGLVPGLYVYRVQTPNGVASGKIVKTTGSNGSPVSAQLNAGYAVVPEFPKAKSSVAGSPAGMTVQFSAVRQGYLTASSTEDVDNGTEILLQMEKLQPGVPSAPLLLSPANGAVGIDDAGVSTAWLGDNLANEFALQVSTSSDFVSVDFQMENLTGTTEIVTGLDPATTYFWRVRSTGTDGTSEWSLAYRFTTVDGTLPLPSVPALLSPGNGMTNVALPTTDLIWSESANASNYNIQLATTNDFASPVLDALAIPATTTTTPDLAGGTIYYWRAQANGDGGTSAWSDVYSFQTALSGSVPDVPMLTAPLDGAGDQATSNLQLSWENATGASTYSMQLSTSSDFSSVAQELSGISTNSVAIFELANDQTYFWRIQSSGPGGVSEWSLPNSFTTAGGTTSLLPPSLLAPSNGANGIAPGIVAISWSDVAGAANYTAQVSTFSDFSIVVHEKGLVESSSVTVEGLISNTEHFWRVRANDAGGSSDWSETFSFTTGEGGSTNEMIALDLMSPSDSYYGLHGGLVDNGVPTVTPTNGKIVIIAISMSNGFQEFNQYINLYENNPDIDGQIELINCAVGGSAIERWTEQNSDLWAGCKSKVTKKYSLDQVKVVWAKNADQFTEHGLTLPDPQADYYDLANNIGLLMQRIHAEFPSVQAVFNSSRIWGGYVAGEKQAARGEPISYEGGFATNTAIERFQNGEIPNAPPWIGWGPYIWANATTPNSSGIFWTLNDFQDGGVNQHPSEAGATKVADALHEFFMEFDWYRN